MHKHCLPIFIAILLVLPAPSFAQDATSKTRLNISMKEMLKADMKEGKCGDVARLSQRLVDIYEPGPHDDILAVDLYSAIHYFEENGAPEKAVPIYKLAICMRGDPGDMQNLAAIYKSQGRLKEADQLLEETWRPASGTVFPPKRWVWRYPSMQTYPLAEQALARSVAEDERTYKQDQAASNRDDISASKLAVDLVGMAEVLIEQQKYNETKPIIKELVGLLEHNTKPEHVVLGSSSFGVTDKPNDAHRQTIGSAYDLATLCSMRGLNREAEQLYKPLIALGCAPASHDYASLLRKTGRTSEAQEMELKSTTQAAENKRSIDNALMQFMAGASLWILVGSSWFWVPIVIIVIMITCAVFFMYQN
jgi:tetratricopeptide (TPR) repeat protein